MHLYGQRLCFFVGNAFLGGLDGVRLVACAL